MLRHEQRRRKRSDDLLPRSSSICCGLLIVLACVFSFLVAVGLVVYSASNSPERLRALQSRGPPLPSTFLFGIPTAARGGKPSTYLLPTLHSLLQQRVELDYRVLVYVVEQGPVAADIERLIAGRFSHELSTGKLTVVTPSTLLRMLPNVDNNSNSKDDEEDEDGDPRSGLFYPESVLHHDVRRCQLRREYGDTLLRVLWRSKITLDAAHLMLAAAHVANSSYGFGYYVHLEDDTPLVDAESLRHLPAELNKIGPVMAYSRLYMVPGEEEEEENRNNAPQRGSREQPDRPMLLPTQLRLHNGFIGIVLRVDDLGPLAMHLVKNFDSEPVDWLFSQYFRARHRLSFQFYPSLFVHDGAVSSRYSLDIDTEPPGCSLLPTDPHHIVCWKQCDALNASRTA